MIRNLYHGSSDMIEQPRFGYGKRYMGEEMKAAHRLNGPKPF